MAAELVQQIRAANADRDPVRLAMKYARMRDDAFAFLRGTAPLFYARMPESKVLRGAPLSWCCGDAHLENFGCYKGDNRLVYFDLNDFDEAALAPCAVDVLRLATSVLVAGAAQRAQPRRVTANTEVVVSAYLEALARGKAQWIERDTATGVVRSLLERVRRRTRKAFLDARTELHRNRRRIKLDGKRALPATSRERRAVTELLARIDASGTRPRGFFRVLDVACRIAGTGSLGVARYVVLVAGKGPPDGHYLLDLKQARPSAVAAYANARQPRHGDEAKRVVTAQDRMQAVTIAFLMPVRLLDRPFLLRGLQPAEDRLSLSQAGPDAAGVGDALATMARLVAWAHLRASGRGGAEPADALSAFGSKAKRVTKLCALAATCAERLELDWVAYCAAYDAGKLAT
jgi:uncharacterized protein (DUF2252 family)